MLNFLLKLFQGKVFECEKLTPAEIEQQRIDDAVNCHDCDYIPKVEGAGAVNEDYEPPYQVMHNGVKVKAGGYHGRWMREIISVLKGHHEPQEEKVFYEVLKRIKKENPVMVELGSFWSYYSVWFKNQFPLAGSYMVEPVEGKLALGKTNFSLNNFTGTFVRGCVGDKYQEEMTFTDWNGDKMKMPQYSVDSIIDQNNIPFIDILHSDIQGAEYKMLKGCRESLKAKKIGYIFISTHMGLHEKCLDFLRKNSMHIISQHTIKESLSADGLIVAQTDMVEYIEPINISKKCH